MAGPSHPPQLSPPPPTRTADNPPSSLAAARSLRPRSHADGLAAVVAPPCHRVQRCPNASFLSPLCRGHYATYRPFHAPLGCARTGLILGPRLQVFETLSSGKRTVGITYQPPSRASPSGARLPLAPTLNAIMSTLILATAHSCAWLSMITRRSGLHQKYHVLPHHPRCLRPHPPRCP